MWFTIKLAWRNIFRNKRRTIIAGTAIGIGLASLIFSDAVIIGMKDNLISSATSSYLGEGQIHQEDFRLTQDVEKTIEDLDDVVSNLENEDVVENFSLRTSSFGMITSPANVNSVMFVGVDPAREQHLSKIDDAVREGEYFTGDDPYDIVIGSELAEILEVALGDRVVVTVSQAHSGDLSQEMFRVSGIYHFNVKEMDTGFAFARLPKAQQMLGIVGEVHEIVMKFKDRRFALEEDNPFWARYSTDGNEAVSWTVLFPEIKIVFGMTWVSMAFMAAILFGIVAFGIINTLFMSLYERLFEFGVIRAVGTRPSGVRRLVIFEAGALAFISIGLGAVLGLILTFIVIKTGIDYRGIEFAGTTMSEILYPVLHIRQFIIYPLATLIFILIVGHYPAVVASKMSISSALRKSL
jgi:ABC-type lipoprotein release transport system permease subunit